MGRRTQHAVRAWCEDEPEFPDGGKIVAVHSAPPPERPAPSRDVVRQDPQHREIVALRSRFHAGDESALEPLFEAELAWFAAHWPEWRRDQDRVHVRQWRGLPEQHRNVGWY